MKESKEGDLERIPATRDLVEDLYSFGLIDRPARQRGLDLLLPPLRWRQWASRLMLAVGAALLLCGIGFFFAHNWARMTPFQKFLSIEAALAACIAGALLLTLRREGGRALLLAASVLAGVFWAVYGQVYQTGADSYKVFMLWSALILGWTVASRYAPQWLLWLAVTNIAVYLWWEQEFLPGPEAEHAIWIVLAALNGSALGLMEFFAADARRKWLHRAWFRIDLVIAALLPMLIPCIMFTWTLATSPASLAAAAAVGAAGHVLIFLFYGRVRRDPKALIAATFSVCAIAESAGLRLLAENFGNVHLNLLLLLAAGMSLVIFGSGAAIMRKLLPARTDKAPDALPRWHAPDLLARIRGDGIPEGKEGPIADFIRSRQRHGPLPFSLRVLAGIGAFMAFAAILLLMLDIFDSGKWQTIMPGAACMAAAVLMRRASGFGETPGRNFLVQISFALMLAGKVLVSLAPFFDGGKDPDHWWQMALSLLAVTAAAYPFYRHFAERFISAFFLLCLVLFGLVSDERLEGHGELLLNGCILLQAAGAGLLLTRPAAGITTDPIRHALLASLVVSTLVLAYAIDFGADFSPLFGSLVLAASLAALMTWIGGGVRWLGTSHGRLALGGSLLLGLLSAPGLQVSLGLMILGHARRERATLLAGGCSCRCSCSSTTESASAPRCWRNHGRSQPAARSCSLGASS